MLSEWRLRIRGFVDPLPPFCLGILFWRVDAGPAIQKGRFMSFGFKGSEPGVDDCGSIVRID